MMSGGIVAEPLIVSGVRQPGERVPVGGVVSGEGPGERLPAQARLHMIVDGDVDIVVVVNERMRLDGRVERNGEQREKETNDDCAPQARRRAALSREASGLFPERTFVPLRLSSR